MRSADQIRQEFIDFFRGKQHTFVPSAPVVPHGDPTLLFTNAGMNQFKDVFLGTGKRAYTRAANTQKCIRAGGKHNDLDDVGHDTYHHTFFEMLGNWSFGDYFKTEAINWAWELLTEVWGIDPTRLHATYFQGDADEGLAPDDEARELWRKILPPERVHPGNKKDNFWEMGDTGPCGPCSEIHIDLTPDKSGGALVNAGDARVIEIWNLVFIQFNRGTDGRLTPLPDKHVDTGMGFERVTAVLQGRNSNYDTDVFAPLFAAIRAVSGAAAYGGRLEGQGARDEVMRDIAYRVIADHIRTLAFAITDGAVPDKEGRGYVLRRILRRAVRYGWQYLGMHEPFLYRLLPTVIETMAPAFPELRSRVGEVTAIIHEEEQAFARTLERGIALFEQAVIAARQEALDRNEYGWGDIADPQPGSVFSGSVAFRLHDTYGFPIDLTEIMARERGMPVDIAEFTRLMEEARERARAGGRSEAVGFTQLPPAIIEAIKPTDDEPRYQTERLTARITSIVRRTPDGAVVLLGPGETLKPGESAAVVTDRTCFYAEAGGQVGDHGTLTCGAARFGIHDTQRPGHYVQHIGQLVSGELRVGDEVELAVDWRRAATRRNHTATHLLNWALREVLGDHVQQKGSLVDDEKTRFDFSHPRALTADEVARVEDLVNARITAKLDVSFEHVPQAEALKIHGLRAVFGEKYPDVVRVMSIGKPVSELRARPDHDGWRQYSIEFCGGTHCDNTAQIEHFALTHEEAVAKGVRRVVGVTGPLARAAEGNGKSLLKRATDLRTAPADELARGAAALQQALGDEVITLRQRHELRERIAELQKLARQHQKEHAADAADVVLKRCAELAEAAERIGDHAVVVAEMPDAPVEQLKQGADALKQRLKSTVVLFGVRAGDKALLLAAVTDDLVKKGVKAGDLVKQVAPVVGGGGGGAPTMAQAGGKDPTHLAEALDAGRAWIASRLGA